MGGLTRTRARMELVVSKICFKGESPAALFLSRILILSSKSDARMSSVFVAIFSHLVWFARAGGTNEGVA